MPFQWWQLLWNYLWCSAKGIKTHWLLFESWFTWVRNKSGVGLTHTPISCPPWMFVEFCLKRTEGKADAGTYEMSSSSVIYVKPPPLSSPRFHPCIPEPSFVIWRAACIFFRLVSGEAVSCAQLNLPLIARASKASWSSAALWFLKMTFRTLSDNVDAWGLPASLILIALIPPQWEIWTCTHKNSHSQTFSYDGQLPEPLKADRTNPKHALHGRRWTWAGFDDSRPVRSGDRMKSHS